jgi:hypothetical protein
MCFIYVLKCENNKYYIDTFVNIKCDQLYKLYYEQPEFNWLVINKPLEMIELSIYDKYNIKENLINKYNTYVEKYGYDNVLCDINDKHSLKTVVLYKPSYLNYYTLFIKYITTINYCVIL